MEEHVKYIQRCFQLAEQGRGYTKSNPMVGAVFVVDNHILSEGYHQRYGEAHAEVNCLRSITDPEMLSRGTLYVSLEPCDFHGKTPPCTQLILRKGIKKLVIGSSDFNPLVQNESSAYLKSHGIDVINLHWTEKQRQLNISFFINQTKQEPYFIGKLAFSRNKIYGRGDQSTKITLPELDALSHKLRSQVDAILVGKNTFYSDKPALSVRHYYSEFQPDIVVLSSDPIPSSHMAEQSSKWINIHSISNPEDLKNQLFERGYRTVLVEGGGELMQYGMNNQLFHEIVTIENQMLVIKSGLFRPHILESEYRLTQTKSYFNHLIHTYHRNDLSHP